MFISAKIKNNAAQHRQPPQQRMVWLHGWVPPPRETLTISASDAASDWPQLTPPPDSAVERCYHPDDRSNTTCQC